MIAHNYTRVEKAAGVESKQTDTERGMYNKDLPHIKGGFVGPKGIKQQDKYTKLD